MNSSIPRKLSQKTLDEIKFLASRTVIASCTPKTEEEKTFLRLQGYEESYVGDHWILWGKK